jgi:hypothetical protein
MLASYELLDEQVYQELQVGDRVHLTYQERGGYLTRVEVLGENPVVLLPRPRGWLAGFWDVAIPAGGAVFLACIAFATLRSSWSDTTAGESQP